MKLLLKKSDERLFSRFNFLEIKHSFCILYIVSVVI